MSRELTMDSSNERDAESSRKNRTGHALTLRKEHCEEDMAKRRNISDSQKSDTISTSSEVPSEPMSLPEIAASAKSRNVSVKLAAVTNARKMLSSVHNPPIDEMINHGLLPILVECLQSTNANFQHEATWALTNIASGTNEQTRMVVRAGAVPHLINLLSSSNMNVCEQAAWALGNIIGDGPHFRDYCIELGIVEPLVGFIGQNIPTGFLRNITWALVNLCRSKDPSPTDHVVGQCLQALNRLIRHKDAEVLVDTLWALSYLTDEDTHSIQMVIDSEIVPSVVELLDHEDLRVKTAALRTAGNISTGTDEQTQLILNCGVLGHMPSLFSHPKDRINKEAVWFVSNVIAGTQTQIQAVLDAGLIPMITNLMANSTYMVQKEALWSISNLAIGGLPEQVLYAVNCGVIPPLCNLLKTTETQTIHVALDSLLNILRKLPDYADQNCQKIEECGGLNLIEELQNHQSEDIYPVAYKIYDEFFVTDDDLVAGETGYMYFKDDDPFDQHFFF